MSIGQTEIYQPRVQSDLGVLDAKLVRFKLYGLLANGKTIEDEMKMLASDLVMSEVLPRVERMGDSNGLGFVIIHPGELGVSISSHWWVQGSVLCQHIYRKLYGARSPIETSSRPVVACVWELALINAEQEAWRQTMMSTTPDPAAYLAARPSTSET